MKPWSPEVDDCQPLPKPLVGNDARALRLDAQGVLCLLDDFPLSEFEASDRQKAGLPPRL